jgi:predicted RNase H-like HicB family nuclease
MKHKYEVIIFWSEEDQSFIADVPELPGCMAHGKTYRQALTSALSAIDLWLQVAKETKRVIPPPIGRRLMYA